MCRKVNAYLLPCVVFLLVVINGILGVDFGYHWDEPLMLRSVQQSVQSGLFLPGRYYYPSFSYDLSLLGLVPSMLQFHTSGAADQQSLHAYLVSVASSKPFHLRVRVIFIVVAALSVLWTGWLVLFWRRNWAEAFLACAILALSWEYSYHLRWIAPDAIMAQFGVLTLLLVFIGRIRERPMRWFRLSAITAGFACATKYPAGLVLLPVLLGAWLQQPPFWSARLRALSQLCLIAGLAYLFVSPGSLLDLYTSIAHIRYEINHYATGHWGYTVEPLGQHLQRMLAYFTFALFSKYRVVAASLFIATLVGAYALLREDRLVAALFLCFPLIYILYLSTQKVMIVRNLLILLPFFAILSAHGMAYLYARYAWSPRLRTLFAGFVAVLLLINLRWAIAATASIEDKDTTNYIEQVRQYMAQRNTTTFWVSTSVYRDLTHAHQSPPPNVTAAMPDADLAIFSSGEVGEYEWHANHSSYTRTWFGPHEVNFNYYPSWTGDKRIVVMPVHHALQLPSLSAASK
jgi:hypothetical protein